MNHINIFQFDGNDIRTLTVNNEPRFVGKDVAETLGYSNPRDALNRHVDEEDKGVVKLDTLGGSQNQTVINESGLYSLILKSKLPTSRKFKRWVTGEVLPSIRKHGAYMTPEKIEEALADPDTIIQLATRLKEEQEQRQLLEQQISEYEPKVNYLDTILSSTNTVTITQIAADYGMSAQAMNKLLNEMGVQHKVGGQWILYRKHMQQGYTKSHTTEIPKPDGGTKVVMNTKWTQKGRLFLYNLLKHEEYYPQMDLELEEA